MAGMFDDLPVATAAPTSAPLPAAPPPPSLFDDLPIAPIYQPKGAEGAIESIQAGFQGSAPGLAWRGKLPDLVMDPQHASWWERALTGITQVASELPLMGAGGAAGGAAGTAAGAAITGPAAPAGAAVGGILGAGAGMFALPAAIRESLIQAYKSGEVTTGADWFNILREVATATAKEAGIGAATFGAGALAKGGAAAVMGASTAESTAIGFGKATMATRGAQRAAGTADVAAQIATMVSIPAALQGSLPDAVEFMDAAIVIGGLKAAHPIAARITNVFQRTGKTPAEQVQDAMADPKVADELRNGPEPEPEWTAALRGQLTKQEELWTIQDRLSALVESRAGKPEQKTVDDYGNEVVIPAKQPELFTYAEKQEYDALQAKKAALEAQGVTPEVPRGTQPSFAPEQLVEAKDRAAQRIAELTTKEGTGPLTDVERAERIGLVNSLANPEALAKRYGIEPAIKPITDADRQASAQRVYDDVLRQAQDNNAARQAAGLVPLGDEHALAVATLMRSRLLARATRLGVLPEDLYNERPLQIRDKTQRGDDAQVADVAPPPPAPAAPRAAAPEVDLFGNPIEPEVPPQLAVSDMATVEVPLANLRLSKEVPQFKKDANAAGVIVPLGGKFDRTGVGPIQIWERLDGSMEVISGRHRLDLARRSGEENIPAQIHREADGFTARQAATLDAQLNIREEQGSVADYAQYFKDSAITESTANELGLLARAKGRTGFAIARDASPDTMAAHRAGLLSDDAALVISQTAPGSERLQALGIAMVNDGKSALFAANTMKAVDLMAAERQAAGQQGDIFGFDDSAMREVAAMAKKASSAQRKISEQISAVSGASRRPELARKMGVDVQDPEGIQKKIAELKQEQYQWDNWPLYPELVAKLRAGDENAAKEQQAVYTVGNEVRQDEGRFEAGRVETTEGQIDLFTPAAIPGSPVKTLEKIVVEPEQVGKRAVAFNRVRDAGEAASVFQDLNRSPMEKFQVLGLDAKGKPIAFFDLFSGTLNQTSVYPREVWTAIYQTPGIKSVWIAHQHPSGLAEPSHADRVLTKSLQAALTPDIGVTLRGHLIITKNKTIDIGPDGNDLLPAEPKVGTSKKTIPIMERMIQKADDVRDALSSPTAVRDFLRSFSPAETGLLVLDAQNRATGWWPMTVAEMSKLRTGDVNTGMGALLRKIGRGNAGAVIAYSPKPTTSEFEGGVRNIGQAVQLAGVKMLDAFAVDEQGVLRSQAEAGFPMTNSGGTFFQTAPRELFELKPETPAELKARDEEAVAAAKRKLAQERAGVKDPVPTADQADLFSTQRTLFQQADNGIPINADKLSREVLSKIDRALKAMGYDSRGADDVRNMLKTRIAPEGILSHPDWLKAYDQATGSAERRKATKATADLAKDQATHVDFERIRALGTTTDIREAGYITPSGSFVDLSGKREGGQAGTRAYDHREAGGTDGMQEFMALGNIRMDHNAGTIDLAKEPTPEQYRKIVQLAQSKNGEIVIDLERGLGEHRDGYYGKAEGAFSREYPAGTKPARILADIQRYYAGEEPLPLSKTLYQSKEDKPWYYSELARSVEAIPMKKGTAKAWHDYIKSRIGKGVKPEEIEATGINDWLATQEEMTKWKPAIKLIGGKDDGQIIVKEGARIHGDLNFKAAEHKGLKETVIGFVRGDGAFLSSAEAGTDASQRSKITKDQVMAFLGQNGVRVEETELNGTIPPSQEMENWIRNDPNQTGTIEGDGITVSSTGMASYYDRIVPSVANDISKKLGGEKVEILDMAAPRFEVKRDQLTGLWYYVDDAGAGESNFKTREAAETAAAKDNAAETTGIGKQQSLAITPAMREKIMAGQALFQNKPQERDGQHLGSYSIAENLITTFRNANKSTIIHELSHSWLEEMKADAARPDAPAQIKADWEMIRREFAIGENGEISTASHEQFARTGERYLGEGVAPSIGLRAVFERFKAWMLEIYGNLKNLGVEINPEVRGIFDRMLATDQEIADAKALDVPRAYVPEARAAAAERIVPPAPEGRKIEPGFEAERASMRPLADELPPGPGEAPDNSHINYAYINSPMDVKLAMQRMAEIDQANIQKRRGGTQGVKSWEEANAEQAKYVNDILGGSEDTLFLLSPKNPARFAANDGALRPGPDVKLGIMKKLAVGAAKDSARLRDVVLSAGHDATVRQQLEYMGSIERARMIQAEFLGERAGVARALNALKDVTEGTSEIARMLDAIGYGEAAARELFQTARTPAEEQAYMRAKLNDILQNYRGKTVLDIAKLHKEIGTLKGTFKFSKEVTKATKWEMVVEGWRASILSGPVTHTTNLFGTEGFHFLRPAVDALAATIGMARGASPGMGESDRASMSEAVARLGGMISGIQDGVKVAVATFKLDDPTGKTEAYRTAIPGRAGELIRIPLRMMGAEDAMVTTMYKRSEIATLAIRQAFDEQMNPSTREFAERVAYLKDHPTPEMEAATYAAATRMTFNAPLGEKGVALQLFVNKWNLQWMIPFIRTPINITKEVARMSPLAPMVGEWRAAIAKGGVERDRAIAETALGAGIMALTMAMTFEGTISGSGDADPGKNRGKMGVWQPYSRLIGDTWYEYARIQPVGTLVGMAADMATIWDHMNDEEKDKIPKLLAVAFSNAVTNQTFLQGITNVINAISEPTRFLPRFANQMAGSMVPNIIAQPTAMADPAVREVNGMIDAIQARIPGMRQMLLPKRDWLGEEVQSKERTGVVLPIREQKVSEDKVRLEAARLNISMAAAPKKTHIGKGTGKLGDVPLTPEERNTFAKVGGEMAHQVLTNVVNAPGYDQMPDLVKRKVFAKVLQASHQVAAVAALPPEKRSAYITSISEKVASELAPAEQ